MRRVQNGHGAINRRVFVEEVHVIDDTGKGPPYVAFIGGILFAFQQQITCTYRSHFSLCVSPGLFKHTRLSIALLPVCYSDYIKYLYITLA